MTQVNMLPPDGINRRFCVIASLSPVGFCFTILNVVVGRFLVIIGREPTCCKILVFPS